MKKTIAPCGLALAALAWAGSLQAHHSGSMYERIPVWIEGTVVSFEHRNPHTIITLRDTGEGGRVREWSVEGPGQSQLERMGLAESGPAIGDTIRFCAFPYKSVKELSQLFPEADFSGRPSLPQSVAGHVMVTADGAKRLWEPHGVLAECIRSSDEQRQAWVDFLNADPRVRDAWCQQRRYAPGLTNASLSASIDEINRLIDKPCP